MLILKITGKAYQVFYLLSLLAEYYGEVTIGEIEDDLVIRNTDE